MRISFYDVISGIADYIISHAWPEKEVFDIAKAIKQVIDENDVVVQFVRMCIDAHIGKTKCYNDAHATPHPHPTPGREHVSIRKKVQLALYEYLKAPALAVFCYRDNLGKDGSDYYGVTLYFIERKELPFFKTVREYFADELERYMGLNYYQSALSTCDADDISVVPDVEEFDFVFEIGELESAEIRYWGYWHNGKWDRIEMFNEFNLFPLMRILKAR